MRNGVGRAAGCVLLCAGTALAQAGPQGQDPEWLERLRAAHAALRAELQELDRRLTALEDRSAGGPAAGAPGTSVAPIESGVGAPASPEELAARLLGSFALGRYAPGWRPDERLWAFCPRGLLSSEQTAALAHLSPLPCAAELKAVLMELQPWLQRAELAGVAVRRRVGPPSPGAAQVGVAELELSLLFERGRRRSVQVTALVEEGRWRVARLDAPWLVTNARAILALLGQAKRWSRSQLHAELDMAAVMWRWADAGVHDRDDPAGTLLVQLPGYELIRGSTGLAARPRLPELPLLTDRPAASFAEQLRETSSLPERLALCEAQIAAGGPQDQVRAARVEHARTRLALIRRAALADPRLDLVPRIGEILAEELDGAEMAALRVRLFTAAGDQRSALQAAEVAAWDWGGAAGQRLQELAARDPWIRIQWGRSRLTALEDSSAALISLWTSAKAARSAGDRVLEAEALAGVAEVHWTVGQLAEAQVALEAALAAEPATAPAQALRVLLALERLEPLTEELVAAAEAARRLDRGEPLAHLACVRVALAKGNPAAAARALETARQTADAAAAQVCQARLDLGLAQGRPDADSLLGSWGSRADDLLARAEVRLQECDAAACAAGLDEVAKLGEPLTPRQSAWLARLRSACAVPPAGAAPRGE